jgi:hypothetical protein
VFGSSVHGRPQFTDNSRDLCRYCRRLVDKRGYLAYQDTANNHCIRNLRNLRR